MSNIPNIRIARITKLVKHNATNDASNIRWVWKEVVTEELQYLNEKQEWTPIPVFDIYDDSAKKKEEEEKKAKIEKVFKDEEELFKHLKSLPNPKEYWHKVPADGTFGSFLDFERAELDYHPADDGWTYYYGKNGKCARFKDNTHFIRGDLLMDFINPERFLKFLK